MKKIIIFIIFLTTFNLKVFANMGVTGYYSPGGTIQAKSDSISMEYEKVVFNYDEDMNANVSAVFKMKNHSDENQEIDVYFPGCENFNDYVHLANDFKVNGTLLEETHRINFEGFRGDERILDSFPAYGWKQNFKANQTTEITIEYKTKATRGGRANVAGFHYLEYIIGTGSYWKGVIGKGEIEFILPEDIPKSAIIYEGYKNKFPLKIQDNKIKIEYENYEPPKKETIMIPLLDLKVMKNFEKLAKNKDSFENNFKIIKLLNSLDNSYGCNVGCVDWISNIVDPYYEKAINQINSKNDLLKLIREMSLFWIDSDYCYSAYGCSDCSLQDDLELIINILNILKSSDDKARDFHTFTAGGVMMANRWPTNNHFFSPTTQKAIQKMKEFDPELARKMEFVISEANKLETMPTKAPTPKPTKVKKPRDRKINCV